MPRPRRLQRDRRGATSIEYGLLACGIAMGLVVMLPKVAHEVVATSTRARVGMDGKTCQGDPTESGIQCAR